MLPSRISAFLKPQFTRSICLRSSASRLGSGFWLSKSGSAAGRNGTQAETGDFGVLAGFDIHFADGDGVAVALLDHELDALRLVLKNLREDEAAGHATEAHFVVERALGIVSLEVLLFRGAVATV